jgi:hypothetical protein
MAIACSAHGADDGSELAKPQLRLSSLPTLAPRLWATRLLAIRLPAVSVIVLALGLGGCARDPARGDLDVHRDFKSAHRLVRATPVRVPPRRRVHAETPPPVELRVRRPDPALLAAQPAPHCEFTNTDLKAVDPDQWGRLKTEFERQCYQDAEKAARDRLSQLQAASTCEIERVPRSVDNRSVHAK